MTQVQPQISSAPCTCCNARSVRHVADRYPPLSKTTCRSQSFFTFRINSSGAPSHPDLRCSQIMLVMVQAWSRAVQVARPSPISIETPPYCSIVRTESAITRTNLDPGSLSQICLSCPGTLLHPCPGVGPDCPSILKQTSVPSSLGVISYSRYVQSR